jgi:hypothetical protein
MAKMGGASNSSNPPKNPNMQAGMGHNMNGGMEGMEEMGIFTTNFAWEVPSNIKPGAVNVTNGFSFGSLSQGIDAGRQDAAAKKESDSQAAAPGAGAQEEIPQTQSGGTSNSNFGGWNLPYGSISPQTLDAQREAAVKADRDSKNLMGLLAGIAALGAILGGGSKTSASPNATSASLGLRSTSTGRPFS